MIYLLTAVIFSALVSIVMRLGENRCSSSVGMFIVNYLMCMVLARFFIKNGSPFTWTTGSGFAVGLGIIAGMLFLMSFLLLQLNIRKNGVVLAAIFMKLGVIVPILIAMLLFGEKPGYMQVLGIFLAITAIIVINYDKSGLAAGGSKLLLLILLVGSGITDSMMNIYDKLGVSELGDTFLFYVFTTAFICSVLLYFIKREKFGKWDLIFGLILGIPNYFSSLFLLLALRNIPAVIVYPAYSVGTILAISLVGIICFREKMSHQKLVGLGIVMVSLVLLN